MRLKVETVSLNSPIVKVHPDGTGTGKNEPQGVGESRGIWTSKLHLAAADARTTVTLPLSPGQAHDTPEGCKLLRRLGRQASPC